MDRTPSDFIELGRFFRPYDQSKSADDAAAESYLSWGGYRYGSDWSKLIGMPGVHVILGEAGSGRTYEFKAKANSLRSDGKTAFYLSLHRLVSEPLAHQINDEEKCTLSQWQHGQGEAFFFLDAVDESKLIRVSEFREALDKFAMAIGSALPRGRIFISSRVKDWYPATDMRNVVEAFGLEQEHGAYGIEDDEACDEDETTTKPLVHVWSLAGLEPRQVKVYVEGQGLKDSESFMQAMSDSYAWELAARPLDVNLLVYYWGAHRRIGHPTEMYEYFVTEQLKERAEKLEYQRAFPLDAGRGRSGVETLAAASIFCRKLDFQIEDESLSSTHSALNAQACLPDDWKPTEIHALLSRPLFDAAIYGCTRFHHRNIAEYLAACWIVRLLKRECPIDEVMDLLFAVARGRIVARQSRLPIAVWLACLGEQSWVVPIRERLLECAPEAFLRHGDPSLLPVSFKERILDSLVRRYNEREIIRFETTEINLSRLGEPALGEALTKHLRSPEVSSPLKSEFAKLARIGRVHAAVPVALGLMAEFGEANRTTFYCLRLVEELGTPDQLQSMKEWVTGLPALSSDLCRMAIGALFPAYLTPAQVGEMLTRLSDPGQAADRLAFSLRRQFSEIKDLTVATDVLRHMLQLLEQEPHFSGHPISQRYAWTARVVRALIRTMLAHPTLSDELQAQTGRAFWLVTQDCLKGDSQYELDDEGQAKPNLATMTEHHPVVRRSAFWLHFDQERTRHPNDVPWHVGSWTWNHHLGLSRIAPADFDWVLEDLRNRTGNFDRCGALHLAVAYWKASRRSLKVGRLISSAISDSADLTSAFKRARSRPIGGWLKGWWARQKWDGIRNRHWWARRWDKVRLIRIKVRNFLWLKWHQRGLCRGELPNALYNLICVNGFDSRWVVKSWDPLVQRHGQRTAKVVQDGCVAIWKGYDPAESDPTGSRSILGLVGLDFLWRSGQTDFSTWDKATSEKATRYALEEMNGFSRWLPELAKVQPSAVMCVLRARLAESWDVEGASGNRVIDRVRWSKSHLGKFIAPSVLELLQQSDPRSNEALHSAIHLLIQHSDTARSIYAEMAAERLATYSFGHPAQRVWILIWIQTDTGAAMDYVESLISCHIPDLNEAREFVVELCAELEDRMEPNRWLKSPRYVEPDVAPRFIRWVYRWVSEETDIRRGSSYSPVARDYARMFRSRLLESLASQSSPEAEAALISLSQAENIGPRTRDYILHLLEDLSRRLADGQPWLCECVREFEKHHQATPATLADLFSVACRRLRKLKAQVEQPFDLLMDGYVRAEDDETRLRHFLALHLSQLSQGLYTIPQEAVVFAELRPDLRLERAGISGSIPIEVKLADGRSTSSLLSDLEGQLVGDYLSSHQSRYGVFVVGLKSDRSHWLHPETRARMTFVELIERLRERAQELLATNTIALGVEIIGIDFRPRESVRG